MAQGWDTHDMPSLRGATAVVTGASSGLGLVTARELARAGATVILAVRDQQKGERTRQAILGAVPTAELTLVSLDLGDLQSVRACAARIEDGYERVDLLINNAGVMAPPRRLTADGFESQFGTNHLGHFALTGLLLGRLQAAAAPRVVTVSSGAHRIGKINFDDLQSEHGYNNWRAYGQSKLANLMFCFELARRAEQAASPLRSLAAHPGYAATNLQFAGPARWYERALMAVSNRVIAQSAEMGALPTLYAAVMDLPSGTFVGPGGFMEQRGYPKVVTAAGAAYDQPAWRRLWEVSESLTGVRYEFAPAAASPR
jgi:NAD(P)-dependent dehydrogenase (short-subunit alcohol dehydrogenase family)